MRLYAILIAVAACLLALLGAGSAGAAVCPNEAFRIGPSALLPACRAYEMVSPLEKSGGNISSIINMHAGRNGEAAEFTSTSSFAGAPASGLINSYIARRGSNWATENVVTPQYNSESLVIGISPASSPELNYTLQASKKALTPGAIEEGSNIYLRNDLTGERALIVAKPGNELFRAATTIGNVLYSEGSSTWNHILLRSSVPMTAGAKEGVLNHYDYDVASGTLSLVNTVKPMTGINEGSGAPYAHRISADGSRIYFGLEEGAVYLRENGATPVPISVTHPKSGKGVAKPGRFGVASADGSILYFTSSEDLVEGDENEFSESLYRYERATNTLTDLTPAGPTDPGGAGVAGVLGASQDGSYVYFVASGALTAGAKKSGNEAVNIYAAHEGAIKLIGRTKPKENEFGVPPNWSISPNGRYFAFSTNTPFSKNDVISPEACPQSPTEGNLAGSCLDAYLYEYESGKLVCVTCNGLPGAGKSTVGGQFFHEAGLGAEYPHSVLDDGTVFVETPNQLLPSDFNGVGDVYAYRAGSTELISTGKSPQASQFGDATLDGRNVFFFTGEQLVPQDIDRSVDVYDDRLEGGLISQYPPTPPAPCEGEGCRGAPPLPSPGLAAASNINVCSGLAASSVKLRHESATAFRHAKAAAHRAKNLSSRKRAAAESKRADRLRRNGSKLHRKVEAVTRRVNSCQGGAR